MSRVLRIQHLLAFLNVGVPSGTDLELSLSALTIGIKCVPMCKHLVYTSMMSRVGIITHAGGSRLERTHRSSVLRDSAATQGLREKKMATTTTLRF